MPVEADHHTNRLIDAIEALESALEDIAEGLDAWDQKAVADALDFLEVQLSSTWWVDQFRKARTLDWAPARFEKASQAIDMIRRDFWYIGSSRRARPRGF